MDILLMRSASDVEACFPVFHALRPHLSKQDFVAQVLRQQSQGYDVLALRHEDVVKSVAGFRIAEFLAWGKVLYIDDLATLPGQTAHGFAGALLDWLVDHARQHSCDAVHLDTGYARHAAHRLYLRKGFQLACHHLALDLSAGRSAGISVPIESQARRLKFLPEGAHS
ncbi:GNAT family N-acetyltransferase [Dyella amyloliquefaciens]|uniref:GNAT family N-acetyltransferase n=1 Tax=Dyella amyloliquefaciens TaxID=1770545 RepID=UPI00102E2888|nr:GNAT family N-acetyltransferase [Dyella amyloliquefaciens]